jgi:hypothetical protein
MATQFLKMEYSVTNSLIFEKKIGQKKQKTDFFWGWCHHIYAY